MRQHARIRVLSSSSSAHQITSNFAARGSHICDCGTCACVCAVLGAHHLFRTAFCGTELVRVLAKRFSTSERVQCYQTPSMTNYGHCVGNLFIHIFQPNLRRCVLYIQARKTTHYTHMLLSILMLSTTTTLAYNGWWRSSVNSIKKDGICRMHHGIYWNNEIYLI